MATPDPQKNLLSLIREFASEKSQGERRVSALKKQIEELQSELDAANVEIEHAKRSREVADQELRGFEVELAVNESSIQALVGRISDMNQEMSAVQSKVDDVKNDSAAIREEFITKMFELNKSLRKFQNQQETTCSVTEERPTSNLSGVNREGADMKPDRVPNELAQLISQTEMEDESIQSMLDTQKKAREELASVERKVSLLEAVKKAMRDLEHMTSQSSQLIRETSALGEELQRKVVCPSCHQDNIDALDAIFGTDGEGCQDLSGKPYELPLS